MGRGKRESSQDSDWNARVVSKFKHPWWGWVVSALAAFFATLAPNLIRTICLVFAVLVAAATFHRTRFANRQWKRTTLAVLLFIIVAAGLFLGAGYFDHFAEKRATADSGTVKEPQIQSSLSAEQIAEEIAKKLPRPTHEKEIVEQHTIKPTVTAVVGRHSDIPRNSPTLQTHERPPTLSDLFNGDFSNAARVADKEFDFKWSDGTASHIKPQTYLDFPANSSSRSKLSLLLFKQWLDTSLC